MGLPVVTIPGTIDNDIPGTEFTIGFDTALNTVMQAVDKLRDTLVVIVAVALSVMGRNCGDMAVWSAIACGAEVCIAKETGYDEKLLLKTSVVPLNINAMQLLLLQKILLILMN